MLRSETVKLGLTQISQRYRREFFRDGFEYITILIKKIEKNRTTTRDNQIFPTYLSTLTKGFPKGYRFAYGDGVFQWASDPASATDTRERARLGSGGLVLG